MVSTSSVSTLTPHEYDGRAPGPASVVGCHTPRDPNTFVATGPDFSGGFEMDPLPLAGADPSHRPSMQD